MVELQPQGLCKQLILLTIRALKKGSFCLTIAPEGFATQCMYVIQLLNNDGLTSCKTAKSMEK